MVLHIGSDEYVALSSIVMILDIRSIGEDSDNLAFLSNFLNKPLKNVNPGGHFKSVILTEEGDERKAYFSPISSATLLKRAGENQYRSIFNAESEHELR